MEILGTMAAAAALALWGFLYPAVRHTTLVRAWSWGIFSGAVTLGVAAGRLADRIDGPAAAAVALAVSLTPFLARLGAKRPQHRAWDLVVAAFLVVLAGAVLANMARHSSDHLPLLFQVAMLIGIAMEWFDCLLSPGWSAATLFGAGQLVLLGIAADTWDAAWLPAAWATQGIACADLALRYFLAHSAPPGWDHVWRAFRYRFGLLWSLRLRERFNTDAARAGWKWRLAWEGFREMSSPSGDRARPVVLSPEQEQALRNLLERFVAPRWIDARLAPPAGAANARESASPT